MAQVNVQEIFQKVKDTKEALERTTEEMQSVRLERDQAVQEAAMARQQSQDAVGQVQSLRQELAEKDQAIQDVLMQNADLQQRLTDTESVWEQATKELEEKSRLLEDLNKLLQ